MAEVRGGLLAGGTDMTCMHASHSLSQCFQVRFWWCQLVACNALVACVIARCLSLCTHPVLQGQASLKSVHSLARPPHQALGQKQIACNDSDESCRCKCSPACVST